ncbi:hypothetical protein HanHA300_Chr14g0532591 [Helianthus annuus]|nr:hypothetical protein HanHA300_Chr14g0532591 [Helianthus annuus]KAJ0486507.1 hypothetical protein HanHA89_Chr14g0580401 [Helianthus annuus]KAJ0657073.1 hypothetical protein HanLR1_Chr14g0542981 [Helianthus annuus]
MSLSIHILFDATHHRQLRLCHRATVNNLQHQCHTFSDNHHHHQYCPFSL